mmetsp:Transcript_36281/g.117297  ORF Transcript_36281/g.117297 Transcript_36281/m.117297 type:complete len:268 (-) Transcript_36281:417-1220(-)
MSSSRCSPGSATRAKTLDVGSAANVGFICASTSSLHARSNLVTAPSSSSNTAATSVSAWHACRPSRVLIESKICTHLSRRSIIGRNFLCPSASVTLVVASSPTGPMAASTSSANPETLPAILRIVCEFHNWMCLVRLASASIASQMAGGHAAGSSTQSRPTEAERSIHSSVPNLAISSNWAACCAASSIAPPAAALIELRSSPRLKEPYSAAFVFLRSGSGVERNSCGGLSNSANGRSCCCKKHSTCCCTAASPPSRSVQLCGCARL